FVLFDLSKRKEINSPIRAMTLLSMINSIRIIPVAGSNFRTSCHTLTKHGLLVGFRDNRSLQLNCTLSETGKDLAAQIYKQRTGME
ncbi:chromosome segregation protein ParM, partial [Xenorhabdus bovienii]|uniref:chromosome segregation protein ParM n=1 Tax=Xenorhabdus bovienii TaxID=40576 RepID=UPI0023B2DE47